MKKLHLRSRSGQRAIGRKSRMARLSQKAITAMLVGQLTFSATVGNAVNFVVGPGDTEPFIEMEAGDTLLNEGTIGGGATTWAVKLEGGTGSSSITNDGDIDHTAGGILIGADMNVDIYNNNAASRIIGTTGIGITDAAYTFIDNVGLIEGTAGAAIDASGVDEIWISNSYQLFGDLGNGDSAVNISSAGSVYLSNLSAGDIEADTGLSINASYIDVYNNGYINGAAGVAAILTATTIYFDNGVDSEIDGDVFLSGESIFTSLDTGTDIDGNLAISASEVAVLTLTGTGAASLSGVAYGIDTTFGVGLDIHKVGVGSWDIDQLIDVKSLNVQDGYLAVSQAVLANADVYLEGGLFEYTASGIIQSLTWTGGSIATDPIDDTLGILSVNVLPGGGHFEFDFDPLSADDIEIVFYTQGTQSFSANQFSATMVGAAAGSGLSAEFFKVDNLDGPLGNGDALGVYLYEAATGPLLQNSAPVGISTDATFIVDGLAQTGGAGDDNTIRGLIFDNNGELLVNNTLTVTHGAMIVRNGESLLTGDYIHVTDALTVLGEGDLTIGSGLLINIDDEIIAAGGRLTIDGVVSADGAQSLSEIVVNGELYLSDDFYNQGVLEVVGLLDMVGQGLYNTGITSITGEVYSDGVMNVGGFSVEGYFRGDVYNMETGIFEANGVVESPNFLNAGLLVGSGTIYGNVLNSGYVNPGNSPGTLTIVGNYTQAPTGTLLVEVESESNHDRLWVTGNAHLDGTVAFGGKISYGDKVRFLRASSITGEFDRILTPSGIRARLIEKKTSMTALFAPEKYSDVARGDNHRSTARALDHFIDATSGDKETVSIALDHLRADEYANAFQQISPAFHETIGIQAVNLTQQQGRLLQQRIGTSRYGIRGFRSSTVETTLQTDRDGKSVSQSKAVKEVITTTEDPNLWSVWLEGNGIFSKVTQAHQVSNGKTRAGGFTLGADYAWNPNFITGLFAGYEGLETKHDDLSRTTMNGSRFGGYATYNLDSGLYFDGIAWGGVSEYKSHRRIKFGSIDRTATADQQAGEISALIGTGYDFKPGNWIMGPTASLQYTYVGIKGFEEDGAKSLNLDVDRQRIHSLRSNLGARIAYRYEVSSDLVIVPELRASWEYEFANDVRTINAQLGGKDVRYRTSSQERASLFAGAGVNALFNNRVSTSLNYNVDVGRSNDTAHIISASFGVNW